MLLRHYLEEGLSKAAIARKLGISVRTIRRWIAAGELDRDLDTSPVYGPRPKRPTKLDPYRGIVAARLQNYPKLSARRIMEEVREAGYCGGYSQLCLLVNELRPAPEADPVVRFETPPGHQAQVDFAEFRFPWGKRYALLVVLGYSRLLHVQYFERQTMRALFDGLTAAFGAFGGVPREILFDQMRAVITADFRLEGGRLLVNEEFLRFAAHWGFRPRACRPYRAKTKGKVERPIRYLRENFVYGRELISDDHLAAELKRWLSKANRRIHRTTGERPLERFHRDEQHELGALPAGPYRSLVLTPPKLARRTTPPTASVVAVEKRPLATYATIARSAS